MPLSRLVEPSFAPFLMFDTPPDGPHCLPVRRSLRSRARHHGRPPHRLGVPTTFTEFPPGERRRPADRVSVRSSNHRPDTPRPGSEDPKPFGGRHDRDRETGRGAENTRRALPSAAGRNTYSRTFNSLIPLPAPPQSGMTPGNATPCRPGLESYGFQSDRRCVEWVGVERPKQARDGRNDLRAPPPRSMRWVVSNFRRNRRDQTAPSRATDGRMRTSRRPSPAKWPRGPSRAETRVHRRPANRHAGCVVRSSLEFGRRS